MRTVSDKSLREIKEFESSGFARSSRALLNYVRRYRCSYTKTFTSGKTGRSIDIFGICITYIYDIRHKKEFIDFLVDKFLAKNPDPDMSIRKAFTRMLHTNGLHWKRCLCIEKDKIIDKDE